MRFLLDTNVISELRKVKAGKAAPAVAAWADTVEADDLCISVITIQELETGILLLERRDRGQGALLRTWLDDLVIPAFRGRILPVDTAIARRSARFHVPNPRPFRNSLIGATAQVHNLTLVTRNVADFDSAGLQIVNPWLKAAGS